MGYNNILDSVHTFSLNFLDTLSTQISELNQDTSTIVRILDWKEALQDKEEGEWGWQGRR